MIAQESSANVNVSAGPTDPAVPHCLVVMYHYVRPTSALRGLPSFSSDARLDAMSVADFEAQLDCLCARYEPIDWPRLCAWREGRSEPPHRSFLLTFDDGLQDHARYVAPALQRRGLHGVFFVPGVVLAEECMLPAHMVHLLMARLGAPRMNELLHEQLCETGDVSDDWLDDTSWHSEADRLYHYETPGRARLKYLLTMRLPPNIRNRHIKLLFRTRIGSPRRWSQEWYLSWDDIVGLQSGGHTVGGHGYLHEPLERLSEAQQKEDMVRVARLFQDGFGHTRRPFSYPYGRVGDSTPSLCRDAGFVQAFTTQERWLTQADDCFLWPRVDTIHVDQFIEQEAACPTTP